MKGKQKTNDMRKQGMLFISVVQVPGGKYLPSLIEESDDGTLKLKLL